MGEDDQRFMRRALELAEKGRGKVHPNPLVGAVLVKNGRIVGEGAHEKFGGPHAEVNAVSHAKTSPRGATLYVTLEPCAHTGKTPPCADFILKNKIKKVVVGARDPNPLVSGKGLRLLQKNGVQVVTGVLAKEVSWLNRDFNFWVRRKTPYVVVKVAQTLDGKIATPNGNSRWITGPKARLFVHRLRSESDAILIGVNTLLKDNPLLTVRHGRRNIQPIKVILDSYLRAKPGARIFSKESKSPVILAVSAKAPARKINLFRKKAEVLVLKEKNGKVDLPSLLKILGARGVVRLLIEGGGEVIGDAFLRGVVNEVYFMVAPKVIGGKNAIPSVGGDGVLTLDKAFQVKNLEAVRMGSDLVLHGVL